MKAATVELATKPIRVRESARPMKSHWGYCKGNLIVVSKGISENKQRAIFLHEALHKLFWMLDETVVDHAADELNEALDELEL